MTDGFTGLRDQIKLLKTTDRNINKKNVLPDKINDTYSKDYNILYIDSIIRKKLRDDKDILINDLRGKLKELTSESNKSQTANARKNTIGQINEVLDQINEIESGSKYNQYNELVKDILEQYKQYKNTVKAEIFDVNEVEHQEEDNDIIRLELIEKYLEIAAEYMDLNIIRNKYIPQDICNGCNESLSNVFIDECGIQICPKCQTERMCSKNIQSSNDNDEYTIITCKSDDGLMNFMRYFDRNQGLQKEHPDESLYEAMDEYFYSRNMPLGEEIRQMPLDKYGYRGNTNHKMLWNTLSKIGKPQHYKDDNLIGHIYWGWTLSNVGHLRDRVIYIYNKMSELQDLKERIEDLEIEFIKLKKKVQEVLTPETPETPKKPTRSSSMFSLSKPIDIQQFDLNEYEC